MPKIRQVYLQTTIQQFACPLTTCVDARQASAGDAMAASTAICTTFAQDGLGKAQLSP